MPSQYIPILIFAVVAMAVPAIGLAIFKRVRSSGESGEELPGSFDAGSPSDERPRKGLSSRVYLVAALIVVLDMATVLIIPWATIFGQMGGYGLAVILVFLGILLAGYAWLRKEGALDWT